MLLEAIQSQPILSQYIESTCAENDVGVSFDPSVKEADYLIIKVDRYFNKNIVPNPRGNDCLIVQRCTGNRYKLYLIELKNIEELRGGKQFSHIRDKFQNCFDILLSDHFRSLFYDENYQLSSIQLYFVSNLIKDKKQKNTKLDALLALKPCHFANRRYAINPSEAFPLIKPC
jgi:hypothetical protein